MGEKNRPWKKRTSYRKRESHRKRELDMEKEKKSWTRKKEGNESWTQKKREKKRIGHGESESVTEKENGLRKKIIGCGKNRISHGKKKWPHK